MIVENLKMVDKCFLSIDKDRTVIETIKFIYNNFNGNYDLFFANGGDQNNDTIPERKICEELNIQMIDGLGGKSSIFLMVVKISYSN